MNFRSEPPNVGNSNNAALHSFYNSEFHIILNTELKEQYSQFMQEYEKLGHVTPVDINKVKSIIYFIPHHEFWQNILQNYASANHQDTLAFQSKSSKPKSGPPDQTEI